MYKLIQNNQKKLLAIFGVLLMVVFIIPPAAQQMATERNPVVGRIGKNNIYAGEMHNATAEWHWLEGYTMRGRFGQNVPLAGWMLSNIITSSNPTTARDFRLGFEADQIGSQIAENIGKHPELFLLLQKEAERDGFIVTQDDAKSFLINRLRVPRESLNGTSLMLEAVRAMLLIGTELRHLNDAIKISGPAWRLQAAANLQKIRLNLADFRASEFENQVPAPTPQQLAGQFEKFKNTPAGEFSATNPLGFGYQVPTRVKLQYIEVPHAQVVDAVLHHISPALADGEIARDPSDTSYDWEVKAAQYYEEHKEDYKNLPPPRTRPATNPATTESTTKAAATQSAGTQVAATEPHTTQPGAAQPSMQTAAATEPASLPAIKPFAQVKSEIIDKLIAADVARQTDLIAKELISDLTADMVAIRRADPAATQPSIQPTTNPAFGPQTQPVDEHMTLEHLEQLRGQIEKKYHVSVQVHEIVNGWEDVKQLASLPGIGTASTPDRTSFPEYAVSFASPHSSLAAIPLSVWEPGQRVTDSNQNTYVFRLTAAEPAHALADRTSIAKQVEQDWKAAQAYDRAKLAAQKLLDAAKTDGLSQAAQLGGHNVISTDLFAPGGEIPGYPLTDPVANRQFSLAAIELIKSETPTEKHPERLVELPNIRRVVVTELAATELDVPEWYAQLVVSQSQRETQVESLAQHWFDYDAVVARLDYKSAEKS
jgi:hypothetical protein